MAVEVNKRKRKHESAENVDEGETEVPKKLKKKSKSPKKEKIGKEQTSAQQQKASEPSEVTENKKENNLLPNGDEIATEAEPENSEEALGDANTDSGFEEKEMKFSKDFKMLNFRTKLRGNNFITELRHFLHVCEARPKMVAKYIEKRGKPLELAEALERIDKTNVLHVAYLCQALQLVVMEILSNQKGHMESAVHACRYFLKSHGNVLELMLKSARFQHRRIALKLLTAIVCVEPQLGRQLLASYDILSNVKTIENFLSHSKFELHEEETVRKCYIHFVMAYLVDGNTLLIRNILDRGALIRALASGLIYDDHVTVCVVLNTLRQYVLECVEISKTKKIHVFDLECCKHIARLYDWHGPKVYAAKFSGKGGTAKNLEPKYIEQLVDAEEREAVAAAVHEFLVMLLTSRKYGITFDAVTQFRQKHNVIQGKIIGFLFKPWCNERKTELVLKILSACPDLARHTVRNFAGVVNPMRTAKKDWVSGVDFLRKIITTLHPRLLRAAFEQMTLTDFSYWIKDVCLPLETLVLLTGSKMLRHQTYSFRLATNRLLLAMFTQYSNFMTAINRREQTKGGAGGNSLRRFKFDILNHILVNFPTVEDILYSLHMSMENQNHEDVDVLQHLDVVLDLVLIIAKENRSFVNKTTTILNYLELLRPLYANDEAETEEKQTNIKLELKAIKTILLLFPKALEPRQNLFSSVLKSLIKAFMYGSKEVQRETGQLLYGIFKNTSLFDAGLLEIDLWLEALHFFDATTVDWVTEVFIEVLQVTGAEVEIPKSSETLMINKKNLQNLFENIENGLSVQAYVEMVSISKLMPLIFKGVELVPALAEYLEIVCLLMYHYYPSPEQVLKLYEMEFTRFVGYMKSWLPPLADKNENSLLNERAERVPHLLPLQRAILNGDQTFENIFADSTSSFQMELNGKSIKIKDLLRNNERIILIYVQQILFFIAQLVETQKLQHSQAERAANFLSNFFAVAQEAESSSEEEEDDQQENNEDQDFLDKLLKYIFGLRLSYIRSADLFTAFDESHLNYLHFLRLLTERCNEMPHFAMHTLTFRQKIIKAIAISMRSTDETKAGSDKLSECLKLLEAVNLDAENCLEILDLIASNLKYSDFVLPASTQKTIYYELLVCVLQRLALLRQAVKCDLFIKKFPKIYINIVRKSATDVVLDRLEESLYNFLLVSHQYIPQLGSKFFDCIFAERKLTKSTIKLACLLLQRDRLLDEEFIKHLSGNMDKKELIYPLLDVAFQKNLKLEMQLQQNIYQAFKSGFMKTIEKPQKAGVIYKEHPGCSTHLIELCMPRSECVDFCNKTLKFDSIEIYQIRLIREIYKKAFTSLESEAQQQRTMIFVNFINLQLQMLAVDLRKQSLTLAKLELFAYFLFDWWQAGEVLTTLDSSVDFSKILSSPQWLNFCKACLKQGMLIKEVEDDLWAQESKVNKILLQLLNFLCDKLYLDYDNETENPVDPYPETAQLFEMISSHSKFYDILLSHRPSEVKEEILHLLFILAKKNPFVLEQKQIPVILGSYQARLSNADRFALALLQLYEIHNCGLEKYRPFIWGESAIAFYALRSSDEERTKLTQQETSIAQVMSLVDKQVSEYTIDNFPIWRKLNSFQQLPRIEFEDPSTKAFSFGFNTLERRIERGESQFEEIDLRLCPKRDGIFEQCYDPAFFIPLMSMCFAPESYVHPARPVQNGLLSLVFAALSSQDKDMRLAAGCVQLRYRSHFESNKFFERPLWLQAYDNIQAGLSELRDSWMKHKKNSGAPRVPFISGLFVAKTFNLINDPTHLLYKQLTMYLRLKSSFNFQCIPEFNVLFYSPEIEHQTFRQFIVEVIRNGIKSSSDLFLLVTTNTFKVLMGFYGSSMSTLEMNLLILSVFSTCVRIPASSKILIDNVGILPWLSSIISTIEFHHFDVIEGLISIINNLWYSLKANAGEFHNFSYISQQIHQLILSLLPHMSARISVANFAKLMNILQKTAASNHRAMSSAQLDHVIDCAGKHFPALVQNIESIKLYGGAGAASSRDFCRELQQLQQEEKKQQQQQLQLVTVDHVSILALSNLRSYVIEWWACHSQQSTESIDETLNSSTEQVDGVV